MAAGTVIQAVPARAPARGYWAQSLRRLVADRTAVAGGVIVVVIVLVALLGPELYTQDPNLIQRDGLALDGTPLGPGGDYPLGTDPYGRDTLARLLAGARASIATAGAALALAALLGVVAGGLAGMARGFGRAVVMRTVDVVLSLPTLLLAMLLLTVTPPSILTVASVIGVGWGAYLSRIVFGVVQSLSEREMTLAAVSVGASPARVLVRHLLPHTVGVVVVYVTLGFGIAIQAEAVFGYIGLGIQPPSASWGNMIADGQGYITSAPRLVFVPAAAIVLTVLGFSLLGDGLRQALDPGSAGARELRAQ